MRAFIKKALTFGFAVTSVSLIISAVVGEFIVKHMLPQETYDLARTVGVYIFEDSDILPFTLKKNVSQFRHIAFTREFTHLVSTNSHATRGNEFTGVKPADTYRILFLGDSITFGWGVEDYETYPALVQKYLNQALASESAYKRVETINAGFTDGNSIDTFYVYYNLIGKTYNPDLVIVDFHPMNDLADMFEHSWDKVDVSGLPTNISSTTHKVEDGYLVSKNKTKWKYEIPILRNSHLGMLAMNALEKGAPDTVVKIKKLIGISQEKPAFTFEENVQCILTLTPKECPEVLWPYTDKAIFILDGLSKRSLENGDEFLITIMPSPHRVKTLIDKENKEAALESANAQKYYREAFTAKGLPYIDLLPTIVQVKNPKDLFYPLDGHINAIGHHVAAKDIVTYLQKVKPLLFPHDVTYTQ
ncbi:SGNH/GDSL hydrolase family protein [Candidatus Gottesmanbacteria bacterium]|nr:SGNH/GDSL hydrolase family protein [Candidatus Gottesmanbacteria bacterium]